VRSEVCATKFQKKEQIAMRIFCGVIVLLCLAPASVPAKEKIMTLSWGDVIWQHRGQGVAQIDTPEKIRESIKTWKSRCGQVPSAWMTHLCFISSCHRPSEYNKL
jgi:hypothetical protein